MMTMSTMIQHTLDCPYIGPRAFTTGEALYGRNREVHDVFYLLTTERVVLLQSPSGAGKTSLIQAGLIPQLQAEGYYVHPIARVSTRPSLQSHTHTQQATASNAREPVNRYILSTLLALEEGVSVNQRTPIERLATMELGDYLAKRATTNGQAMREVLIFDQLEELFLEDLSDRASREAFFSHVGATLRDEQRFALFSIHEDYVARLDPYVRFIPTQLSNTFHLDLLGIEATLHAIQQPIRQSGMDFTDAAARKLVNDLRRTRVPYTDGTISRHSGLFIEPMHLQVVCMRIWEQLPANTTEITTAHLETIKDPNTTFADYYATKVKAVAQNTGARERTMRDWFDQHLCTDQLTRQQVREQHEATSGLSNRVIQELIDAHLIQAIHAGNETWFELTHNRLVEPIHINNRAWRDANLNKLQHQAALWDMQKRPDVLLLRDQDLEEAELWVTTHAEDLYPLEQEFLDACRASQARQQERQFSVKRLVRTVAAILVVVAITAVLIAYNQHQHITRLKSELAQEAHAHTTATTLLSTAETQAEEESKARATESVLRATAEGIAQRMQEAQTSGSIVAESQRLAFAAQEMIDFPDISLLLAYEAVAQNYNPITEQSLRTVLDHISWRPTTLTGHTDRLWDVAFSSDGQFVATASNDNTAKIWTMDGALHTTLKAHTNAVRSVEFSPDGQYILTTSSDNTAKIWSISGIPLATLEGHANTVWNAQFSPNGQRIVTASVGGTARIWTLEGKQELLLEGHRGRLWSAEFSPDGQRIVTASSDRTARVWDAFTGEQYAELEHNGEVAHATYSPNGNYISTISSDQIVRIWGTLGEGPLVTLEGFEDTILSTEISPDEEYIIASSSDNATRVFDMNGILQFKIPGYLSTFSPDGKHIATAAEDNATHVWNEDGKPEIALPTRATLRAVVFSPNGHRIATMTEQEVNVWSVVGPPLSPLQGHSSSVLSARYSPDGQRIVTASSDATAQVWNTDGSLLVALEGHLAEVVSARFSPDGQYVVTASNDTTARVWDMEGKTLLILETHTGPLMSAAFSPDGQRIVTASRDGTAMVWSENGDLLATLADHAGGVLSATFSPDGQKIVTTSDDSTARIWDVSGQLQATLEGHTAAVVNAAFSPDGHHIVTASHDNTARVWANDGTLQATLTGHTAWVNNAVFSPDGQTILTASHDNTARLWHVDGTQQAILQGHIAPVVHATFSPDGQHIATASHDNTARLWSADGTQQIALRKHIALLTDVAFSPEGKRLVTASSDTTVRQHIVNIDDLLAIAACRTGRNLTEEEVEKFTVLTPTFDFANRQCPPPLSWES